MSRYAFPLFAILFAALVALGCGGVASNPTQPPIGQPPGPGQPGGEGTTPSPEDLMGQLSGAAAEEEVLSGSFETLWPRGLENLESGQLVLAGQYFKSAFAQDPQSADAAIAYGMVDIMRDHRRHAVFLHPGVDRLFANTPLIGHPEVFPNPFLTEDSYFLRLAALGCRTRKLVRTSSYPFLAPIDSEMSFGPEALMLFQGLNPLDTPTPGDGPAEMPGSDVGGNTVNNRAGGGSGANASPPADAPPDRMGHRAYSPPAGPHKAGLGKGGPSPTGDSGAVGTGRGTGGFPVDFEGPFTPGMGPLPERDEPLSEDEWEVLIREYREAAARDGADIVLSVPFYQNLQVFHDEIAEHIANLEEVRPVAEEEGYALSLPMNVFDGTQKITLQFDVDDYHLLLDHYRLLDALLTYVDTYNHRLGFMLPTEDVEDQDGDNILTPEEYLPDAPFGTLSEEGRDDLVALLPGFLHSLSTLHDTMRPLLEAAREVQAGDAEPKELFYLSSFHRDFVLIEQWSELLMDIADKSSSGTATKLASGVEVTEVVVVYDALFISPLEDIRLPLPSYDLATREVITDDEGNWSSDPTFGGFFLEGLTDAGVFNSTGRLSCVVFDEQMGRAEGNEVTVGLSSREVDENGLVTFDDATVNELVGTPYVVTAADGAEAGTGVVRSLFEVIPLFDVMLLSAVLLPEYGMPAGGDPGGRMVLGPGGTVTEMGPADDEVPGATTPPVSEAPAEEEGGEEGEEEAEEGEAAEEGGDESTDDESGEAEEEGGDGQGDSVTPEQG